MASASAGSIYVEMLLNDGKYIEGLNRSSRATNRAASSWQSNANKTAASFTQIINPVNSIGTAVAGLSGILAGALSIRQVIAYSDQYKGLESRLGLVTESATELAKVQDELYQIAQQTSQPLAATVDAYTRLSQSLNTTQKSQTDLIRLTELLSKTLVISGTDAAGAATFYQQFGQAASSDFKAIGQELQTFADQNPAFYGILRDEANKYGKTLKKMAEDGELSFDFISKAVIASGSVIDEQANSIAQTVGKSFTKLENSFFNLVGKSDLLNNSTTLLSEGIQDLAEWFDELDRTGVSVKSTLVGMSTLFLDLAKNFKEYQAANAEKINFFGLNDERVAKLKQEALDYQKMIDDIGQSLAEDADRIRQLPENKVKAPKADPVTPVDEKALKAAKKLQKELDSIYDKNESYITGQSKAFISYSDTLEEISRLYEAGRISADEYYNAVSALDEEFDKSAKKASVWAFDIEEASKQAARNIQDEFADFLFDPFAEGLDGMLMGFLNVLKRMAAEAASAKILSGLFGDDGFDLGGIIGKIGGAFAGGSVATSGGASANGFLSDYYDGMFAEGGFIQPGHFGIAGEAGAELVFGGKSGATVIPQSFGGGVNVNIINNNGSQVSQSQRQTSNGLEIDVMIDQAVAANIGRKGSRTNQALNAYSSTPMTRR